jgi:hypothetical protein
VQLVDVVIKDGTDIYQHTTSAEDGIMKLTQLFAIGSNMIHVMPLAFALMARITEMPTNISNSSGFC